MKGQSGPGPSAAPRLSQRGRRLALVLPLALLVLSTPLSGCITLDFFLPQDPTTDPGRTGPSLVRVWAAAEPGALGREFAHYNVTFGGIGHAQDILVSQIVPMNSTLRTADLVRLERDEKAVELGSIVVRKGTYYGITFRVTEASIAFTEVVGNDDGREVTAVREQSIHANLVPGLLRIEHYVPAASIVDLFMEINLRKSLTADGGNYAHATLVSGISYYVNGIKAGETRYDGTTPGAPRPNDRPRGPAPETLPNPIARFHLFDSHDKLLYDSHRLNRRAERVVGLGEDLRFESHAYSQVSRAGERAKIQELVWNFADGTSAAGPEAVKNFTSGGVYDVTLTARDEIGLVGRQFGSIFVPYRPDESLHQETAARAGTLLVGSATIPAASTLHTAVEKLSFPEDLESGDIRLGGYRITARFADPTGSVTAPGTTMRVQVGSGHLDHTVVDRNPIVIETAGMPFWRGPLKPWVDDEVQVTLELLTGADVSYDLTVEALYFENMSRGFDPHAAHRHGEWLFGPDYRHVRIDGTVAAPTKED